MVWLVLAYLASALYVTWLNLRGEVFRLREVREAVLVGVIWPLVLLPWRQWLSSYTPKHMSGVRA